MQIRDRALPNLSLDAPHLSEPLPRIPSPDQQTPRTSNHLRDEPPTQVIPKAPQGSPPIRSPLPPIPPLNKQSRSPPIKSLIDSASNPGSGSSPNTLSPPLSGNQTSQIPHLPPIHNSGSGFESHQGNPPNYSYPPEPPGFELLSKSKQDNWRKRHRTIAPQPEAPTLVPIDCLPPIPKPSNWANMTASEKDNWRYKHK